MEGIKNGEEWGYEVVQIVQNSQKNGIYISHRHRRIIINLLIHDGAEEIQRAQATIKRGK